MDRCDNRLSFAAAKKKVLCVGNTVVDCISIVKKFPEPSKPEKCGNSFWQRGGTAANTATVLQNLGVSTEIFVMLSTNPMFELMLHDLRLRGIETGNCPRDESNPPFSLVFLTKESNTCTITNCTSKFPYVTLEDFKKLDLNKYGWIHFRGREPDVTTSMMELVAAHNAKHKEKKIFMSMDVTMELTNLWPMLDLCDFAFFSKQLATMYGWPKTREACRRLDDLFRQRNSKNRPYSVFLWGSQGAGLLDQDGNYVRMHAYKIKRVVDGLGAGDAFVAAFIYAMYVRERSVTVAATFANRMAAHKCTKFGFDHLADILKNPEL
ncbi:hypothetical protein KR093_002603 [Drosophila rubida]|uniref:Carbohydrate kinase PfkB domain-containing protein n=1 Tax=Drosophila rubida TaxID=30044 RepID=A0AAD4JZ11_9MUSC|nr:hypothetical protein KR093_002603 [Drosophila rubida]